MSDYTSTTTISGYHAHVYFKEDTTKQAIRVCENAADLFGVTMGNVHERPVGPHPMFSCQLGCTPEQFSHLLPWLALNRGDLIVFCHPETGDHLADHSKHTIWLGEAQALNLSIFEKETAH